MKTQLLVVSTFFLGFNFCIAQTVDVKYLNPKHISPQYEFLRLGSSSNYFAGVMHNISSAAYGDGDDFALFTYANRDMTFATGTGNVIFFPSSGGNVGIGEINPLTKLDVNGKIRAQNALSVNRGGSYVISLNGNADGYITGRNNSLENKFVIASNGNTYFNGGNVGVGISNPLTKLDVNGKIRAQNALSVNRGGSYVISLNGNADGYITGRNNSLENKFIIASNGNTYFNGGNVGVGISNPSALFEVNDNLNNQWLSKMYNGGGDGLGLLIQSGYGGAQSSNVPTILQLEDGTGNLRMKVQSNGKVGIGTPDIPNGYKLAVGGRVISEEVNVQLEAQWPDFVFKNTYKLPNLQDVEQHIQENGHLQNIPSEKEVKEKGINLGEMDAKLLQKIEELMLYTIQQQKEINSLRAELLKLK